MFDVVTYALLKKTISQVATGIEKVEYKDGKLIFTLPDGNTIETPLDIKGSDVKNISLNPEGALVVEFNDGTNLIFAAATKEELAAVEKKVETLETSYTNLNEAHNTLSEAHAMLADFVDDLGLSVVDGKLNITYNEGE
jgi:coenzyme F420-reducing hydrogenase beta subunit